MRKVFHSTTITYGYAGMKCYRVYDWHPSKKTNVIGALVDKCLLSINCLLIV
ncbi:hypothetical protein [Orientia tsutsugamushi]|uniref:hypothetical protein n=1 Tax=Orientia tsutsugamushi TaxID=784 RepID=UPI0002F5CC20|nr:hypothetical protein [Orientia tsutsugamushi]